MQSRSSGVGRLSVALLAGMFVAVGCSRSGIPAAGQIDVSVPEVSAAGAFAYGPATPFGTGTARTYVLWSTDAPRHPIELGVAMDAAAVERATTIDSLVQVTLALPAGAPEPFQIVSLEWNPTGHQPPGIYDVPHFDFHFYTVPWSEVEQIVPGPEFAARANNVPTGDYVPEHYMVAVPPGADATGAAVPQMGVHWVDRRSPELQGMMGNHASHRPFTHTFIYGSWNGRMTFYEPMITREFLLSKQDVTVPIPTPRRHPVAGWYPSAYRISFDTAANEYRVTLVQFARQD